MLTGGAPEAANPPGTKFAGLIGAPAQVEASLSPAIHNAAFKAVGMDAAYVVFGVAAKGLRSTLRMAVANQMIGLNVTMPHKVAAAEFMDDLSPAATKTGAVNTIEILKAKLVGHNTDGEGLVRFIEADLGESVDGRSVLVLGAGGAARSVVWSLTRAGARRVTVAARDPLKAARLCDLVPGIPFQALDLTALTREVVATTDLIINATPHGQAADKQLLVPLESAETHTLVIDLVYRPAVTGLVADARAAGLVAHGGLGMLVHQAALSFEIWTGISAPLQVMYEATGLKRAIESAD